MNWKQDYEIAVYDYDIDKADKLKNEQLKKMNYRLFRYRTFNEYNVDNVKNKSMWMSYPDDFNDPFEFATRLKSDDTILRLFGNEIPDLKEIYERAKQKREKLRKKSLKEFTVCCFMEANDSELMWSHYTNGHQGFCIEYDFSEKRFNDFLYPVCYRDDVFEMDLSNPKKTYLSVQITKSRAWEYENEWRIIFPEKDQGLHESPSIKAVYLGIKANESNKLQMKQICEEQGIDLFQMEPELETYRMKAVKVI